MRARLCVYRLLRTNGVCPHFPHRSLPKIWFVTICGEKKEGRGAQAEALASTGQVSSGSLKHCVTYLPC